MAHLLFNDKSLDKRVVGLTSTGNAGFCEKLGCFDEITVYGTESELDADLPGAKPAFFFAPTHMGKRDKEWGQDKFWEKAFTASIGVTQGTAATLDIKAQNGAVQAAASWHGLLARQHRPDHQHLERLRR